jgi:hypothetical protein
MTVTALTSEERLIVALGRRFWAELQETGYALIFDDVINEVGTQMDVPQHLVDHVVRQLVDGGLLWEKQHGFFDAAPLARAYGEQNAREEWRAGNAIRHEILRAAIAGYEDRRGSAFEFDREKSDPPLDASFEELAAATRILDLHGCVEVHEALGGAHWLNLTPAGYDLARDEEELRRVFPRTATEDEQAHAQVVPDILGELVTSCDGLLRERGWTSALEELERGDSRYAEGNWIDAVSEYYSAVESGLRYRIDESGQSAGDGLALRDLAKRAAELGLVPPNYQALFGFLDSIRSPRKHGRGPRQHVVVEVGPAEALLMRNHARALLVYLGHRP